MRDRVAEVVRAGIDAITAEIEAAKRLGQLVEDTDDRQLAFELHAYAMEANWTRQLLDDDGAGHRARTAIERAVARASLTKEGNTS